MNCDEFKKSVVDARRGQQEPGAAEHARSCAGCARYLEEQRMVMAALAAVAEEMADESPGPALERRLLEAFERQRRPRRGGAWWKWAGVAACLLVVLVLLRVGSVKKPDGRKRPGETQFYALPGMPLDIDTPARVIRVRLPRADLQRFGLTIAGRSDSVDADVLVGVDGLPRAVRPVSLDQ